MTPSRTHTHGLSAGLPVVLVVLALVAAGCGGSSGGASSTSSSGSSTASAPVSGPAKVTIKSFKYMPATITVKSGAKLTWTNRDSANHTVNSDTGTALNIANLPKGKSGSVTLTKPGTYAYHCAFHPFMHGKVVVK